MFLHSWRPSGFGFFGMTVMCSFFHFVDNLPVLLTALKMYIGGKLPWEFFDEVWEGVTVNHRLHFFVVPEKFFNAQLIKVPNSMFRSRS